MEHHGFLWAEHLPGLNLLPTHVATSLLVAVLLIVTTWMARLQLSRVMKQVDGGIIPDSKLTFRNFFEILAEKLYAFTESVLGRKEAAVFFPFIGTLFLFIFSMNIIGLFPGFIPPTDNLNTTLALGIFVFITYNYLGFKEHGIKYLKQFMGPVLLLAPLMIIIELVSHVVRPISLGLRLQGNMQGDHTVLSVFSEMTPLFVPVIFLGLGAFVCFVQAFVFCLLTMVYISLATSHDH